MIRKRLNIFLVLIAAFLSSSFTYFICKNRLIHLTPNKIDVIAPPANPGSGCEIKVQRLDGYKYIKPFLFGDKVYQSSRLYNLKKQLEDLLLQLKQNGEITNASVYIKDYKGGDWIGINENQGFNPGSLIKVPILLTFLKMEEQHSGILSKKITFDKPKGNLPIQTFNSNQIQVGNTYTIKELLKYMVSYSDNNATYLLNNMVDLDLFKKLFTDLNLPEPDIHDRDFKISAKDYSSFLKIIYNAGYLSNSNSEFAAELLSDCDFKEGIVKGLPENTNIMHKFGEWGNSVSHQLHESGFIYCNNHNFLLTVMTQGNNVKELPNVISDIAKISFDSLIEKELSNK